MGSSFAAGPGVTESVEGSPARCGRSKDNYAQLLARRLDLNLDDVSCSGAKTDDILMPSRHLPAQIDAVDVDTGLVTITIGGNDLGYIGGLMAASCMEHQLSEPNSGARKCWPLPAPPNASDYKAVEDRMSAIAQQIRQRAPNSVLVFVDYATVINPRQLCEGAPLPLEFAQNSQDIADTLVEITERVANKNNALVIKASTLTRQHHTCSTTPWMRGYPAPNWTFKSIPYHPTLEGMIAIADGLEDRLKSKS